MDIRQLLDFQTQRGAKLSGATDRNKTTIEQVISNCRRALEENSDKYRDFDPTEKKAIIKQIIIDFVMNEKPLVDGYTSADGVPDTVKLVDKLIEAITNYDFLTEPINDDSVNEIRANGKWVKIEKDGKIIDLKDADGNVLSFNSPEQQEIIMKKLLGDVRCTPADALVNGITLEGYRIAAVHSSAISVDPRDPHGERYSSFVLRKFKENRMTIEDIIKFGTMSDEMGKTLKVAAKGLLTLFTVGPTSSGKTTTNNAFINCMDDMRVVLIQNPSEIDARKRDETGRTLNDVLHMEAHDVENPTPTDPTPENEMDHTLRLSPEYVVFGEWRRNIEFEYGMKLLLAGHPVNSTYHSETVLKAYRRFLTAYCASSGEPPELAAQTLADAIDLIMVQKFMRDGTRKVIEIAEIAGIDENNRTKPIINTLFRFFPNEPVYNSNGELISIGGEHRRVGKISDELADKLKLSGIRSTSFEFLTKEPSKYDKQTYTGENIEI